MGRKGRAGRAERERVARFIGGYQIGATIAVGGVASVLLGQKRGPGGFAKTAAIKLLHPHLASERALVEMFLDEARLAACVNHPNLCRVLDFGEAEGTFFLALDYVHGENFCSLLAALARDPAARARRPALCAYVLAQACHALHALHEAKDGQGRALQIVHRELVPQNLMIAYDGSVRVLDLGGAAAADSVRASGRSAPRGRYAYMAPEQLRGLELDRRADIWSLGVMLREALGGENPFLRATPAATILAISRPALPAWPIAVPAVLRLIADCCLAHERAARFEHAGQLGAALSRALRAQGESALAAELASFLRRAFAAELAAKQELLRELGRVGDADQPRRASRWPLRSPGPTGAVPVRGAHGKARWWTAVAALALISSGSASFWFGRSGRAAPDVRAPARALFTRGEPSVHGAAPKAPSERAPAAPAETDHQAAIHACAAPDVQRLEHRHAAEQNACTAPPRSARELAPSAARASARPPLGTGVLVIGAVEGWAEVFRRGGRLGATPLKVELPSGVQRLGWRPYGAGSLRYATVAVKRGAKTKLYLDPREPVASADARAARK